MNLQDRKMSAVTEVKSTVVEKSKGAIGVLDRHSFFPIKFPTLDAFYQKQKKRFWTPEEINYGEDRKKFNTLSPDAQRFVKFILSFFAQIDGLILENLVERFIGEVQIPEQRSAYAMQLAMENIHNETYSILIDTLITDEKEKKDALNAIETIPSIGKMGEWVKKHIDSQDDFLLRLIAFAFIEGVMFSGAFIAIYWIKFTHDIPGLTTSNELISIDEGIHEDNAITLFHVLTQELGMPIPAKQKVMEIIESGMVVVEEFIRDALKVEMIGMNADEMIQYVRMTCDYLTHGLNYGKKYNVQSPYLWTISIGMKIKTNFFEENNTGYSKQGKEADYTFDLNTPF